MLAIAVQILKAAKQVGIDPNRGYWAGATAFHDCVRSTCVLPERVPSEAARLGCRVGRRTCQANVAPRSTTDDWRIGLDVEMVGEVIEFLVGLVIGDAPLIWCFRPQSMQHGPTARPMQ
jgi:hypothetical protein